MIRGIFFDLYGTLLVYGNMKKAWADWLHHFYISLKTHGLTISKQEFSRECSRFWDRSVPVTPARDLTIFEKRILSLCTSLGIEISDGDIGSIADLIAGEWQKEVELDKDAVPVLQKLKENRRLALVSNFDHPRHVRKCLSSYGLGCFFDAVVISGDVGVKKPDPGIFKPALSAANLTPGEVAYVGDTDVDAEAAIAAGMVPILINRQDKGTNEECLDFENVSRNVTKSINGENRGHVRIVTSLREILCV